MGPHERDCVMVLRDVIARWDCVLGLRERDYVMVLRYWTA